MATLGLNVGKWTKKWQWTANLWYNWPLDATIDGVQTRSGNFLYYALAGEYAVSEKWSIILEFFGQEQGKTERDYRMRRQYRLPGALRRARGGLGYFREILCHGQRLHPDAGKEQPRNDYSGAFF